MLPSLEQIPVVFLASAAGCLLIGQRVIHGLIAMQWLQPMRHEDCPPLMPLQQVKRGTPTMGGLLVLGVAVCVAVAFGGLSDREGWVVLGALVGLGVLGFVDDVLKLRRPNAKGLRSLPKLLIALGVGAMVGFLLADAPAGYRQVAIPWRNASMSLGWLWIPLSSVVIAGCAHAVNLTDGMDGLAVGCLALAFGTLALLSLMAHERLAAVWCVSLAGACAGFLWFNAFPASVFLGDVGALGLGASLGVLALCVHAVWGLLVIGGIFMSEAVSVMLQVASYRWRQQRRIFRVAPLHHHFQVGGISEPKLVVRFWIAGLLLAALGLTAFAHS